MSHDEITVREARPADLPHLVRFNVAMALETEGLQLDPATVHRGVETALADPTLARYWVAEAGSQIVGGLMITWEWSDWRNGCFWWIQSVYVEPAHRQQGCFSKLHGTVRDEARADPACCGLRLYVERENRTAQQTYMRLAMEETPYRLFEEEFSRG